MRLLRFGPRTSFWGEGVCPQRTEICCQVCNTYCVFQGAGEPTTHPTSSPGAPQLHWTFRHETASQKASCQALGLRPLLCSTWAILLLAWVPRQVRSIFGVFFFRLHRSGRGWAALPDSRCQARPSLPARRASCSVCPCLVPYISMVFVPAASAPRTGSRHRDADTVNSAQLQNIL